MRRLHFSVFLVVSALCTPFLPLSQAAGQPLVAMAKTPAAFRFPAEFEPHSRIWMSWPTYSNKEGWSTEAVQAEIINGLHGASDVGVVMLTQDDEDTANARTTLASLGVEVERIQFREIPHMDIWMRDMGPNFLKRNSGRGLAVADYGFNTWGYEESSSEGSLLDGSVDREVAAKLELPVLKTEAISEGGNREFDDKGTLMLTEAVEIQRNWNNAALWPENRIPESLTREMLKMRLESEYRRTLGVQKVIWVPRGVPEDDLTFEGPKGDEGRYYYTLITTGGHIDEFARFAPDNVILLGEVTPEEIAAEKNPTFREILAEARVRLEEAHEVLRHATNAQGESFRIVRIPMPRLMEVTMKPGDGVFDYLAGNAMPYARGPRITPEMPEFKGILASSYLNFLVTNGVVLFQSYERTLTTAHDLEAERIAMERIGAAYPGRRIVKIHPEALNAGGGGVHCITQQEPRM